MGVEICPRCGQRMVIEEADSFTRLPVKYCLACGERLDKDGKSLSGLTLKELGLTLSHGGQTGLL